VPTGINAGVSTMPLANIIVPRRALLFVFFSSPKDGAKIFMGPEESIKIQSDLGADIVMIFESWYSKTRVQFVYVLPEVLHGDFFI
jgi:queuine/archaeosine tRNA-ribosyltransferase